MMNYILRSICFLIDLTCFIVWIKEDYPNKWIPALLTILGFILIFA